MCDYFRVHLFLAIWSLCVHLQLITNSLVDADRAVTVEGSLIDNSSIPLPIAVFNATSVNITRKPQKSFF